MSPASPSNKAPHDKDALITPKSLQLSLSAPRCPPHYTAHRSLLLGGDPSLSASYVKHHTDDDHQHHHHYDQMNKTSIDNNKKNHKRSIRQRIRQQFLQLLLRRAHSTIPISQRLPHPHLLKGPEAADEMTRFLGTVLPIPLQNHCRDSGLFGNIADYALEFTVPILAITNPKAAIEFRHLTTKSLKTTLKYGTQHKQQFIDMLFPDNYDGINYENLNGLVFFIHGGAWGSGKPWYYRLIATPFLKLNLVVAIVGYRTYPGGNVNVQVRDLELAAIKLSTSYPHLCGIGRKKHKNSIGTCVMGHSSGAHIGMLMVIEQVKRIMQVSQEQQKVKKRQEHTTVASATAATFAAMPIDSFVGISGPYDISHHFDYEAARGVEEISPLKPACGYTREQFRLNSPALRLEDFLPSIIECNATRYDDKNHMLPLSISLNSIFPKMLLVHGMEDDVVPFTATSTAGKIIRSCGVSKCEESYIPVTGHPDTVMHVMLGGETRDVITDWLLQLRGRNGGEDEEEKKQHQVTPSSHNFHESSVKLRSKL